MAKFEELLQKRAALTAEARLVLDRAEAEKRELNHEDTVQFDKIMADVDALKEVIDREERMSRLESDMESRGSVFSKPQPQAKATFNQDEYRKAFKTWAQFGFEGLSSEQRALMAESRAQSAVTGSAGGYTVPTGFYNQLIDAMKAFGGIREAGPTVLSTASGNNLPIPTVDDTSNVGAILAENATAGQQDVAFGQKTLGAHKYTSKVILVPFELMQDSAFDMEAYLSVKLAERIGRITNTHFTTGTGTGQPQGIVTGATAGVTGSTGQATSITYENLIDLQHSVNRAYRLNAKFMFNDKTLKAIRKLKDNDGQFLWQPSLQLGTPDRILGFNYIVNDDVAEMAANAKSVLFGDFSNYFVRDVQGVELYRIVDKYIESGQVGFVAFSRHDGLLVDAGGNPIKYYQNSAT